MTFFRIQNLNNFKTLSEKLGKLGCKKLAIEPFNISEIFSISELTLVESNFWVSSAHHWSKISWKSLWLSFGVVGDRDVEWAAIDTVKLFTNSFAFYSEIKYFSKSLEVQNIMSASREL